MTGPRIRVWLDDDADPRIDFIDASPLFENGLLGIKTWGAPVSIDSLSACVGTRTLDATAASPATSGQDFSRERALQAFCLLMLNLNELVYVD